MILPRKNSSGAWARLAETGKAARITAARPQTSFPMGINDALRSPGLAHHCSGPDRPRKRGRVHSRVTIARTAAIAYDQLVPVFAGVGATARPVGVTVREGAQHDRRRHSPGHGSQPARSAGDGEE